MAVFADNYKLYVQRITTTTAFVIPDGAVWARIYVSSGSVRITDSNSDQITLPITTVLEYGNAAARNPKLTKINIAAVGSGINYNVEYLI